jgi:CRP-like cAMP-binding protein
MNLTEYINHPLLKQYLKHIPKNTILFQQGQSGNTMYVILRGTVELLADRDGEEHIFGLVESGQFLGEKAIVRDLPYQRVFGARSKTELTVLELALKDIAIIYNLMPDLMMDIMKRMFQVAAERLDKANYLARILRPSDNVDRLAQCILFFAKTSGQKTKEGLEVTITAESIHYYIDMPMNDIEQCLIDLTAQGILTSKNNHVYCITDSNALLNYTPQFEMKKVA